MYESTRIYTSNLYAPPPISQNVYRTRARAFRKRYRISTTVPLSRCVSPVVRRTSAVQI